MEFNHYTESIEAAITAAGHLFHMCAKQIEEHASLIVLPVLEKCVTRMW